MQLTEFVKQTVVGYDAAVKRAEKKAEDIQTARDNAIDIIREELEGYLKQFSLEGRVVVEFFRKTTRIGFDHHAVATLNINVHDLGVRVSISCPQTGKDSDAYTFRINSQEDVDALLTIKENLDTIILIKQSILNNFNSGVKSVLETTISRL